MKYSQAAKHFPKAIEAMLGFDPDGNEEVTRQGVMDKWGSIELEIQRELKSNPESMSQLALMSEGFMISLSETVDKVSSLPRDEHYETTASLLYLDLITTAIIRAFAIGVHCQRAVSEVELLDSLVEK